VKVLDEVRRRYGFALVGYVVMPEHVHLLMSGPEIGDSSKVLQVLQQRVSKAMRERKRGARKQMELQFDVEAEAPVFWQRRFYDFNVWGEKKLREKLNYMPRNRVVRGLVKHPKDWSWSSGSFYEKGEEGMIEIELAGMSGKRGERQSQKPHPYNEAVKKPIAL
jgi:REP-associated tyrosine transposase